MAVAVRGRPSCRLRWHGSERLDRVHPEWRCGTSRCAQHTISGRAAVAINPQHRNAWSLRRRLIVDMGEQA